MNKNIYRVIFNKARGLMMVVSEIVTGHSSVSSGAANKPLYHAALNARFAKLNTLSVFTTLALGTSTLIAPVAYADIITDTNAPLQQQADVTTTANGIPQIHA